MAYGVRLKVWGPYACFTRPEMKVERVSYDVITPSAARGILDAIYWHKGICWVVDTIHVLNRIKFTAIRRNELKMQEPVTLTKVLNAVKGKRPLPCVFIEKERTQRSATILKDVAYVIEAHFEFTQQEEQNPAKHIEMFKRRARNGQCYHRPYLGCREFPAHFDLIEGEDPPSEVTGQKDLGMMLYDRDYEHTKQGFPYHAFMTNGRIPVERPAPQEVES